MNGNPGWQDTTEWADWHTTAECFAYFFRGATISTAGEGLSGTSHVCAFLQRQEPQHAVVRLDAPIRGRWQDVRVPLKRLEYMSRPDREAILTCLSDEELWDLANSYGLRLHHGDDVVQMILDFEFSRFAGTAA